MAHFAQLDEDNIVIQVIVLDNKILLHDGELVEQQGVDYLQCMFGDDTKWKQTSYNNNNIRHIFAGIGYSYIEDIDEFRSPKPYPSWSYNSQLGWYAPVAYPEDDKPYYWNEDTQTWIENTDLEPMPTTTNPDPLI
jgi:hypothetical protein